MGKVNTLLPLLTLSVSVCATKMIAGDLTPVHLRCGYDEPCLSHVRVCLGVGP